MKLKDCVCSIIVPDEFLSSTSPSQLPAFPMAVSVADKEYIIATKAKNTFKKWI